MLKSTELIFFSFCLFQIFIYIEIYESSFSYEESDKSSFETEMNDTEIDDNDDDDVGISIETTQDGTLKLSCADPQVLQVFKLLTVVRT